MTKKILAAILALAMVFALCLTACGNEQAEAEDTTKAAEKETTKAAEEKDTTAADTGEEEFALESIDWFCRQDMTNTPDFEDYVWPAMQEYFLENLNLQVEYHGFSSSDYPTKFQAAITSNTGIDLMFVAQDVTGFYVWYERNALEPLDDLLANYAPELVANTPDYAFQSCSINGAIYAMPTVKDLCTDIGLLYNETLLQDLGLEDAFFDVQFENAKDLDEFYYAVDAARDEAYPDWADKPLNKLYTTRFGYYKGDEVISGIFSKIDGLGCFEDQSDEGAFLLYKTADYADACKLVQKWVNDGINPYDAKTFDYTDLMHEGAIFSQMEWGLMVAEREQYIEDGWYQELRHPDYAFSYTIYPLYCAHAINALTTESKKIGAMRLYNTLAEDGYVSTSMRFGLEDTHWKRFTDDNGETRCTFSFEGGRNSDLTAKNYYFWYYAEFGDLNSVFLPDTQGDGFIEAMNAMNNNAKTSKYMGFLLATTNIENEVAAYKNVVDEFNTDLIYGMIDDIDGRIDAFNASLEANGVQVILDECNTQMADWLANN